jgi:hypothetical protein
MVRNTMKSLLVALVAAFALSSMAEAAPKKTVKHRAKHTSRVSSGAPATAGAKPAAKKKPAAKAGTHAPARRSANGTAKKPTAKRAPAKHKPTTKPR